MPALARATRALGASVIENCAVRTIEAQAGRVAAVVTEKGRVKTDCALLTGGAWSTYFAGNLGLDLPQLLVRSSVARTNPSPDHDIPNINAPGFDIRRRADGGYTIATGDLAEHYVAPRSFKYFTKYLKLMGLSARDLRLKLGPPRGYPGAWGAKSRWTGDEITPFEEMRVLNPPPSEAGAEAIARTTAASRAVVTDVGFAEIWAGMIDVTPDAVPYLCDAPSPEGFFIGTGMSGHGFGIGPGVGRVLADVVQGRPPGHDLSRFRFERFSDGSPIVPGPY